MRSTALCSALALLALAACAAGSNPKVDVPAEQAAIRALEDQWSTAAQKHDVEAGIAMYAPDGTAIWPDAPAARGHDALHAAWTEMFKTPGITAHFVPETITISQSGDLASDFGHVDVEMDGPAGRMKDTEKYLVVWKKIDGKWKVLYDTYNSNHPAQPAPPATPPASPAAAKK